MNNDILFLNKNLLDWFSQRYTDLSNNPGYNYNFEEVIWQ